MFVFKQKRPLEDFILRQKNAGKKIGFVPTMGALHAGHRSLIATARQEADLVVCSIFVNPTQFNDPQDFTKYPSTPGQDILQLTDAGTGLLFLPSAGEIYPHGPLLAKPYDLGYLETLLEGKYRPGHFQGVAQVVHLLLDAVKPDLLFLGQKDFQQCMIIRKLIEMERLPVELRICPTLREPDGLAMSSRNLRLREEERKKAPVIFQCLEYIKANLYDLPFDVIRTEAFRKLESAGFKADYVEIAGADDLQPLSGFQESGKIVALIAARIGEVRLIDNILI